MLFRKGFLYKQFNLKQLEWSSQGQQATIAPTLDERKRFLEVYDRFRSKLHPEADGDSSDDEESDRFVKLLVQDFATEFNIGDKIVVVKGDLQGAQG